MAAALAEPLDLTPASAATAVAAMLEAARSHRQAGRRREAAAGLEAVLQARPHLSALQLELAELHLELDAPEPVARQLGALLTLQGQSLAAGQRQRLEDLLLEALQRLGRWEEAEPLLQRRLGRGQAGPADLEALARAAETRGELATAEAWLQRSLELDPERAERHRDLGRLRRRLGRWSGALEAMARAVSLAPLDTALEQETAELRREALWARGEEAMALERWAEARAAYGALLDLEPGHPLAGRRLVLLQQLDPRQLQLAADWQADPTDPSDRAAVGQRLERFSRLLDRLEAQAAAAAD